MTEENHERKSDEMIIRLEANFADFLSRYERDQMEKDQWRASLDAKIDPVVRDHEIIVRGGKWFIAGIVSLWGIVKGWFFLKDHLR